MDGCRESDSPRVSTKPSHNGSGAPGLAEGVESRELAEGNLAERHRGRTQGRETLTQVSDRYGRRAAPARLTRGRSPVRSCRTPGSVRGVLGHWHPYRDPSGVKEYT
jgi:hypothetical protein